MKYVNQFGILVTVCTMAELLYILLGLPIPASVYGLVLMLLLLILKVVKLEQVDDVASFFISIMPILFLGMTVGLMETVSGIGDEIIPLIIIVLLSTIVSIVTTGAVAQALIRKGKKKEGETNE